MAALTRRGAPHENFARSFARSLARSLARDLLEFVLPQRCPGCGVPAAPETLLCERCRTRLPRLEGALCARCLRDERPPDGCRRHPGDAVHAAYVYDERVALLVHALKFGARPRLARTCAPAMAALRAAGARTRGAALAWAQ